MTGKTHRVGGMLCCLGGYTLLEANGMLLGDVNPLLQLTVMYPFAIYGSVVSDLDHHWQSSPSKDAISYFINKVLHITTNVRSKLREGSIPHNVLGIFDAKHRSWQTHSDLFLIAMIFLANYLLGTSVSNADSVIIRLISLGFVLGVISHLVLDMLTPEGVWSIALVFISRIPRFRNLPSKISLVPNTRFFRTGGTWESIIKWLMWSTCLVLVVLILYRESPYVIHF